MVYDRMKYLIKCDDCRTGWYTTDVEFKNFYELDCPACGWSVILEDNIVLINNKIGDCHGD